MFRKAFTYMTIFALATGAMLALPTLAFAGGGGGGDNPHAAFAMSFLYIAIILVLARISNFVERFGQPAVLGELMTGVILGNLALIGITFFEGMKHDQIILFLAELGVVILLFQIGLESNVDKFKKNGMSSLLVAIAGVVIPLIVGTYFIGPLLFPDASANAMLFLGAALTATSVGITARVLKDLGLLKSKEAQIVLGAAVFDDILGLILLSIVTAIATKGSVTPSEVGVIVFQAFAFLGGSIIVGRLAADKIVAFFAKIHAGVGMKFTISISFGLVMAFFASQIGLAPIIGAFAAGLILDPLYFRSFRSSDVIHDLQDLLDDWKDIVPDKRERIVGVLQEHDHKHVEDIIESVSHFFVPIFFVATGLAVDLEVMLKPSVLISGILLSIAAIATKFLSGYMAPRSTKRSLIGFSMVPRGEVGLIFAAVGASLNIISEDVFSAIIIMVFVTTLMVPPVLSLYKKK